MLYCLSEAGTKGSVGGKEETGKRALSPLGGQTVQLQESSVNTNAPQIPSAIQNMLETYIFSGPLRIDILPKVLSSEKWSGNLGSGTLGRQRPEKQVPACDTRERAWPVGADPHAPASALHLGEGSSCRTSLRL